MVVWAGSSHHIQIGRELCVVDPKNFRLGIVGLGKLGSPMVGVFADAGFNVVGSDISSDVVTSVARGIAPVDETGLQGLFDTAKDRIAATADVSELASDADVIFVIVPTPSGADAKFTNQYILDALKPIGEGISNSNDDKLVVITSTVMPGSTGGEIRDALETASGRKLGENLGLCYNPEFIALGSVVRDMQYPDFILIGESSSKWGDWLEAIYKKSCKNTPEFRRMNFVNAEITKISVNTFTTTKISYANMLSELCDNLDGADADVVAHAVGADSRVGIKYLKAGVGYGGPCFPRDNKAFIALADSLGTNAAIARATDVINDHQLSRFEEAVVQNAAGDDTVGVIGLAYKNNTQVTEASQGWILAERLSARGYRTWTYDHHVQVSPEGCVRADGLSSIATLAKTLIVMLPLEGLAADLSDALAKLNRATTVIDPWRALRSLAEIETVNYVPIGSQVV